MGQWTSQRLFQLAGADRLGAEGKANQTKGAAVTLDQHPGWFSKPTDLKNHFVFPIRAPALIPCRPHRQINELKAAVLARGEGKQLTAGLTRARGCGMAAMNESCYMCPEPTVIPEDASGKAKMKTLRNKTIQTIKGNFKVPGIFLNRDVK